METVFVKNTDTTTGVTTVGTTMSAQEFIELCMTSSGKKANLETIANAKAVFTDVELAPLAEFFVELRKREGKKVAQAKTLQAVADSQVAAKALQDKTQVLSEVRCSGTYWELRMPNGVRAANYEEFIKETGVLPSRVLLGIHLHNGQPVEVRSWINSGLESTYARAIQLPTPKTFFCKITSRVAGQDWYTADGDFGGTYTEDAPFFIEGSSVRFID
jgi:hypothetical protein